MDQASRQGGGAIDPGAARATAAALLRSTAAEAAGWIGCPVLLFACEASDPTPRLRAAAKVPSAGDARSTALTLTPAVSEAIQSSSPTTVAAPDGFAAAAGLHVIPLLSAEGPLGALVIGLSEALSPELASRLEPVTAAVLARLEAFRVGSDLQRLRSQMLDSENRAEEKSDEVLRLSEELFAQDIELLQNNEKLGKIEKLKNDFIEKMSRELRTPLNSIIESIIAVLAGENDALSDAGKQSLRTALDEGTSFLRTLQNILDLWRIKQGELPVEIQDVNFREVVEEAIFSIQDTLGDKPIAIEKRLLEPFPKIRTDLAKINQILFLLLDNAAKFVAEGKIEIEAEVAGGRLQCEIRDTGIGICPDDQEFIFDEFYQVDDLASTKYRGAGLGLALVRDLIILLDGSISVSSEVGEGTSIRFALPVQSIA